MTSNYKLLETVATTAVEEHVSTLNALLAHVSRKLFGLFEVILNSPMRVKLSIKEDDIDYEMASKSAAKPAVKATAPAPKAKAQPEPESKPKPKPQEKKDTDTDKS